MTAILLVEDNPHITRFNTAELKEQKFDVYSADTLLKARDLLLFHPIDLIVLDVMLPDGSGIDFCREYRKSHQIPVLFLTALDSGSDIVEGLKAGGDDYLTKPYDIEEFLARINALLRRSGTSTEIAFGGLLLNRVSLRGYLFGEDMHLAQKEYSVLLLLVRNAGQYISREKMYSMIWDQPADPEAQALKTTVSRLKRKLDTERSGIDIAYERERGYCLFLKKPC